MVYKTLKKHFFWFKDRIDRDRIDSTSAHGAFFIIISFLPFVAFLLTLMQKIHFSSGIPLIEAALEMFPDSVADYIMELLPSSFTATGVMPVAVIASIWSSSMGMVAIIKGLDTIFEVEETRGYIRLRVIAVVYVLIFALVIIVTASLLVFGNTIYNSIVDRSPPFFATLLVNFKSLAGFILLLGFFTLLYCAVPRRRIRFLYNLAGAAFSAAGWVLFSFFFSLFVEYFSDFSVYGSLATLVMLMFWLFFCMYIMFLGAEVAMWLQFSGVGEDLRVLFHLPQKKHKLENPVHSELPEEADPPRHKPNPGVAPAHAPEKSFIRRFARIFSFFQRSDKAGNEAKTTATKTPPKGKE